MSSGIEFEVDKVDYGRPRSAGGSGGAPGSENEPKMIRWLMKMGIVKTPAAGQGVMIAVAVVGLILAYILIKYFV